MVIGMRQSGRTPESKPSDLRSHQPNVILIKYLGSIFWLIAVALWLKDTSGWRLVLVLPLVLLLCFHLTLAVVEFRGGALCYRRFLRWKVITCDEVVSSGLVWAPFIGFIRLNRFLPPWSRLYFVLDPNLESNPFRRADFAVLRLLKEQSELEGGRGPEIRPRNDAGLDVKLLTAGVAGLLVSVLRISLAKSATAPALVNTARQPGLIYGPVRFLQLLGDARIAPVVLLALVLLTIYTRRRPGAWTFAFLAGLLLPSLQFIG
jgi:hypothetical protein